MPWDGVTRSAALHVSPTEKGFQEEGGAPPATHALRGHPRQLQAAGTRLLRPVRLLPVPLLRQRLHVPSPQPQLLTPLRGCARGCSTGDWAGLRGLGRFWAGGGGSAGGAYGWAWSVVVAWVRFRQTPGFRGNPAEAKSQNTAFLVCGEIVAVSLKEPKLPAPLRSSGPYGDCTRCAPDPWETPSLVPDSVLRLDVMLLGSFPPHVETMRLTLLPSHHLDRTQEKTRAPGKTVHTVRALGKAFCLSPWAAISLSLNEK